MVAQVGKGGTVDNRIGGNIQCCFLAVGIGSGMVSPVLATSAETTRTASITCPPKLLSIRACLLKALVIGPCNRSGIQSPADKVGYPAAAGS